MVRGIERAVGDGSTCGKPAHWWWSRSYGRRVRRATLALPVCVAIAAVWGASGATAEPSSCPNEAVRLEQASTFLPECRAYELVSAPRAVPKFAAVSGSVAVENVRAAVDGSRMSYASYYPPEGSSAATSVSLARRGENGWMDEGVTPSRSTSAETGCGITFFLGAALLNGILSDGRGQTSQPFCGHNEPSLVTEEPSGWRNERELEYQNIFLRENLDASPAYRLVNRTPTSVAPSDAHLQDASRDLSHVVFSEAAQLVPEAPQTGEALYEWVNGVVRLVSALPNGEGVDGQIVDGAGTAPGETFTGAASYMHGVSDDGSLVFFTAEGKLFARKHADQAQSPIGTKGECVDAEDACTVQVDASQAGGTGGGGKFLAATRDGSKVFFSDEASAKLTSSTLIGSKQNLYEYEVETGKLTDLTAVSKADLVGASGFGQIEGGSPYFLYFVAEGAFASGAMEGQPNLYVIHDGEPPVFITTLDSLQDKSDWNLELLSVRTSPDGRFIAFDSAREQQTTNFPGGYDNIDLGTGVRDEEIYLYDAESQSLSCVSCQPDGAQPAAGGAEILQPSSSNAGVGPGPGYLQRNVSTDGRVFFQTAESLVSNDLNGTFDVYEYVGGEPYLLSTGTSPDPSMFVEAGESGRDVFFATTQALVGGDRDGALSVYDARIEGGFPEPQSLAPCAEEACRGVLPSTSALSLPPSLVFSGPGNPAPSKSRRQLTRKQKLKRALSACRRKPRRRRQPCEAWARKRFGGKAGKSAKGGRR